MKGKLTKKQKFFHIFVVPILFFVAIYIIRQLIGFYKKEFLTEHEVLTALAFATGLTIAHWLGLFYPSKPPQRDSGKHKKSLKSYIKQYVINGTPFNRLMVIIYSLSAVIVIIVALLRSAGRI